MELPLPDDMSDKMARLKEINKRMNERDDYFRSLFLGIKVSELVSMSLHIGMAQEAVIEVIKLQWAEIEGDLKKHHIPVEP